MLSGNLTYEIYGWYSHKEQDPLTTEALKKNERTIDTTLKSYNWQVDDTADVIKSITGMACYGVIEKADFILSKNSFTDKIDVVVGNTGTEALSAYLASSRAKSLKAKSLIKAGEFKEYKERIEEQLEALQLSSKVAGAALDNGTKLRQAMHEKGFAPVDGGLMWRVQPVNVPTTDVDPGSQKVSDYAVLVIPAELTEKVLTINVIQKSIDSITDELACQRQQLFTDWYKYMIANYHIDIEKTPEADRINSLLSNGIHLVRDLENKLLSKKEELKNENAEFNTDLINGTAYELKSDKGPRFWQPNEPVILLAGPEMQPGARNRAPDKLLCMVAKNLNLSSNLLIADIEKLSVVTNDLSQLSNVPNANWNPVLLQWEVLLEDHVNRAGPYTHTISTEFITANFNTLKTGDYDLSYKNKTLADNTIKLYSGSNIFSDHAKINLLSTIVTYLLTLKASDLEIALCIPADNLNRYSEKYDKEIYDIHLKRIDELKSEWKNKIAPPKLVEFCSALHSTYQDLVRATTIIPLSSFEDNLATLNFLAPKDKAIPHFVSQSLSGFNAALLQLHQTKQLPIRDPLAFLGQKITEEVNACLTGEMRFSPLAYNDFNPIKTGTLRLNRLSVVDNFGQVVEVPLGSETKVVFSKSFDSNENRAFFPPRIIQPARVNLEWLSAANGLDNMEKPAATDPVCGWFIPNNLDQSLMVYDSDGKTLGSIQSVVTTELNFLSSWLAAPGSSTLIDSGKSVTEVEVPNAHLRRIVNKLIGTNEPDFTKFLEVLDETLDEIDPENFAQYMDLAMLMGRPIAVVRASVSLEVKGTPAVNQGWEYFALDLGRDTRETNGWEHVQFPMMIGEPGILNDGVLGFWNDGVFDPNDPAKVNEQAVFQSVMPDSANILSLSVVDPPTRLTMLLDPRGQVHVTSGVLPAKSIAIPAELYKPALKKMSITFFTRPLLTPKDTVTLSLPDEAGYVWSWITEGSGQEMQIVPMETKENYAKEIEVREGWLKLTVTDVPN